MMRPIPMDTWHSNIRTCTLLDIFPGKINYGFILLLPDRESTAHHTATEPDGAATGANFLSLLADVGGVAAARVW